MNELVSDINFVENNLGTVNEEINTKIRIYRFYYKYY